MSSVSRRLLSVLLIVLPLAATAQKFELNVTERKPLPSRSAGLYVGGFKSDSSGNVYFMPAERDARGWLRLGNSIVRLSLEGEARFDVSSVPELKGASVADYSLDPDGNLYMLAIRHQPGSSQVIIARFDPNGKYVGVTRIELPGFVPTQIAVFGSGDFLLAGWRSNSPEPATRDKRPFTGTFNSRGQLLTTPKLANDVKREDDPEGFEESIGLSIAEAGPDGYVYLARASVNGPVYVIRPSGQVVRRITLKAPGNSVKLVAFKPTTSRVAVVYEGEMSKGDKTPPVTISVFDSVTGNKIADYFHQSGEIGTSLVQYVPEVFTFISSARNGNLQFVRAAAR